MDNQLLRDKMRRFRAALSEESITEKSHHIIHQLENDLLSKYSVDGYLCYYPTRGEVDLRPLYLALLDRGVALYFPVTMQEEIRFFRIRSLEEFSEGAYHIMEPPAKEVLEAAQRLASFTPGLCFSSDGNRLGYGGGYYDRFFAQHPDVFRIGICYDEQLSDEITVMDWDVRMQAVVCESGVFTNL